MSPEVQQVLAIIVATGAMLWLMATRFDTRIDDLIKSNESAHSLINKRIDDLKGTVDAIHNHLLGRKNE